MSQLTFQFPFKTSYYEKDFYVSKNNFEAYKLIESWPSWPGRCINIFGPHRCGKTHLSNILKKKINSHLVQAENFKEDIIEKIKHKECLIIDDYNNNIEENFLYTVINMISQNNKYILVNSLRSIKNNKIILKDLKSRLDLFVNLGIDLPTDDLLRAVITKCFSDKQVVVNMKILEYIVKNIDRSYENIFKFIKEIDKESLSTGKSININLIKKVLNK